jgi:hypothetical protein
MLKIQVTDTPLVEKKGIGKTSGKPFHMRTQIVYAYTVTSDGVLPDFPEKFEIDLEDGQTPYPRGVYTLHPSTLYVKADNFGHPKMTVGRPRLVPVPAAKTTV